MRGVRVADVLPVLQVPDNKAYAVPCERLQERFFSSLPKVIRVAVVKKNILAIQTTGDDMINRTRDIESSPKLPLTVGGRCIT